MLKGKSSYQKRALSQASESSHAMIISRPGRRITRGSAIELAELDFGNDPIWASWRV